MSTTPDISMALSYSLSNKPMPLRLRAEKGPLAGQKNWMNMGIDISYLSAFPAEREILYPPLTYLRHVRVFDVPADRNGELVTYRVIEVTPTIA